MNIPATTRLGRLLGFASAVMWAETAWTRVLAWPVGALGLFAAVAAGGAASAIPGAARTALMAVLLAGVFGAALWALASVRGPKREAARARLEQTNRLPVGLLAPLLELPAARSAASDALWCRALAVARQAQLLPPAPRLSRPLLPSVLAAVGLTAAAVAPPGRIASAFSPYPDDLGGAEAALIVEPPAYTARDSFRVALRVGGAAEVRAPAGSRVRAAGFTPEGRWRIDREGDVHTVRLGRRQFASLTVNAVPDQAPRVTWSAAPAVGRSGLIALRYQLADDYGGLLLTLVVDDGRQERTAPVSDALAPGSGQAVVDLSADPAAGREVALSLLVRDAAGQSARSAPVTTRLPARTFADPLARAIVDVRRQLLDAPAQRGPTIAKLDALSAAAAAGPPAATFPALRSSAYRLAFDRSAAAVPVTAATLWDAAVARDGGPSAAADSMLRAALDRLARALGPGGSEQAARTGAAELERALAAAMAAMRTRPGAPGSAMEADALAGMAQGIAERIAAGDRDGARAMLAALRAAIDGLRLAGPGGGGDAPAPEGFDPMGRPGAGFGGGAVKILEPERVRELERIRATLRERAADAERPKAERDYYRRLIDRF